MLDFDRFSVGNFISLSTIEKIEIINKLEKELPKHIVQNFFSVFEGKDDTSNVIIFSEVTVKELKNAYDNFGFHVEISEDKLLHFEMIMKSLNEINESLKPLSKILEVEYEIGIVGGALRDLLLNKKDEIKDVDIVFSLQKIKGFYHESLLQYNKDYITTLATVSEDLTIPPPPVSINFKVIADKNVQNKPSIESIFNINGILDKKKEILNLLNIPFFDYQSEQKTTELEQFFHHIIKLLLMKKFTVIKDYPPRPLAEEILKKECKNVVWDTEYDNPLLRGVVKLESQNLPYPVDILICQGTIKNYVLQTFDFELCKTWISYKNNSMDEFSISKEISVEKLISTYRKINVSRLFINDMQNKTLSITGLGFDLHTIENVFNTHYQNIKYKYKEYPLTQGPSDGVKEEVKNYIKHYINYDKLNDKLSLKVPNQETSSKRIKI